MLNINLQVYTVPLGASLRGQFARELSQQDYGSGVLILPTGLLQNEVRAQYNVQVSGFDTLANKILNLNGYVYLDEVSYRSQQLVVQEALAYCQAQGKLSYLARLAEKQGFVQQMTSLLTQLSRSGATAAQITMALSTWERAGNARLKDLEVAQLYTAYRMLLKLQNRFDLEGKYRLALKILREQEEPRLPWQQVYVSDFATLDALQRELLLALSKHVEVQIGLCYDARQSVCAVSQMTLEKLTQAVQPMAVPGEQPKRTVALQHVVENIGRMSVAKISVGTKDEGASVAIREYAAKEAEIAGVLTEIKEQVLSGAKLQDFAVAVYDLNKYAGLRRLADAYGLPVTLAKTEPALGQPLTEFVRLLLGAVPETRQGAEAYFGILSSGLGKLLFGVSLEGAEQLRQETYFARRSSVQQAVVSWLDRQGAPPASDSTKPQLLEQVDAFLAHCPLEATVPEYTEQMAAFISELKLAQQLGALYKAPKLTLAGLQAMVATEHKLQESLQSLAEDYQRCDLAEEKCSLSKFSRLWQESLQEEAIVTAAGRKDGLLVTTAVQLAGLSFKKVYLLGLREGEFPAGNRENWLYNDKERGMLQTLGVELPTTYSAYASDASVLGGAVAAATEQLVLSYAKDDAGEASPYVDAVAGLFTDVAVTHVGAKPPASVAEALAQSSRCESTWLVEQMGVAALKAAGVDRQRQGAYNGVLTDIALLQALKLRLQHSFSATALEQYVSCPFKFLGTQLWQEQGGAEKSELLDGGTRGSLFHETLKRFVQTYLGEKPTSYDLEVLWPRLQGIYQQVVAEYAEQGKLTLNELWDVESARLERLLGWWLSYELAEQQEWTEFQPWALEQSFGYGGLAVRLETGKQEPVFLKGRIDRVDASATQVMVTDYKTGSAPGDKAFGNGKDVQMAFYLLAAERLCKDKQVAGGTYLSLKERKRQGGVAWTATGNSHIKVAGTKKAPAYAGWEQVREACLAMLVPPVEQIYVGNFAVAPTEAGACTYCPLQDICRH